MKIASILLLNLILKIQKKNFGDWDKIGGLIKGDRRYDSILQSPDMMAFYLIIY